MTGLDLMYGLQFILVHNRDEDWTRKTFDVQDNGSVIAAIDSRAGASAEAGRAHGG